MGVASLVRILAGLIQMKVVAIVLGPAGVGLIGLFQNLMGTAAGMAALGSASAGTRQIAEAAADGRPDLIAAARRALVCGTAALALCGGTAFFLARGLIAEHLAADPLRAGEIGWLALGVALTVLSGSQRALLNGLRRTRDLALVQIGAAVLSTLAGLFAVVMWRERGILVFVLAAPLASLLLGHVFVRRLARPQADRMRLQSLVGRWRAMACLGAAFMAGGLAASLGHLTVRGIVQHELGLEALGQFQAAWSIAAAYLGFVLSAMATDYYPRLTAAIGDRDAVGRLVAEQSEIGLLLAGPVLVATAAFAPAVLRLLYSPEFGGAADVLRWQAVGDVLKVASWPLGFVLMASGRGTAYLLCELAAVATFVAGVPLLLPVAGIEAAGYAFLAMYAVYLPLVLQVAGRRIGLAWSRALAVHTGLLVAVATAVVFIADVSQDAAAVIGGGAAVVLAFYAWARLSAMAGLGRPPISPAALGTVHAARSGVRLGRG